METEHPERPVFAIKLLGREYQVGCAPNEQVALQKAVQYVDAKMREIRQTGRVVGMERIAVMTALNLAHELMRAAEDKAEYIHDMSSRIRHLQAQLSGRLESEAEIA